MNILLTNDDGIYADGIYALYQTLSKVGKVTVVAPDTEKSSVGHGITLSHPIWLKKIKRHSKFFGYGITGTPADCVKFAASIILKKKPDLVVSGINWGANDGCSVFYSGTVAAAREAALMGIPSIAISLATFDTPNFKWAAQIGAQLTRKFSKMKCPSGVFLNINVPAVSKKQIKGIKITGQGLIPIHETFQRRTDPSLRDYFWMSGRVPVNQSDLTIDTCALTRNYVTVTPIHCDMTHYPSLKILEDLSKK